MQTKNILVVEDSPSQALRLAHVLESAGWHTRHAATAAEAMELLGAGTPDLVLVDYYLPGIRGDELCRQIRMRIDTRVVPIVILTADPAQELELRGLESGADDVVTKSVEDEVLLLRMRALLAKSAVGSAVGAPPEAIHHARLLAIDDSSTYLAYLTAELGQESHVVETARSGVAGLERVRKDEFDCVLVDLVMPEMDGIEVCRRINELRPDLARPPMVLMLTGHEDNQSLARALDAGADDFVGKSSDIVVIKGRVRSLLRRKSAEEEHRQRLSAELRARQLEAEQARMRQQAAEERAALLGDLQAAAEALRCTDSELRQLSIAVRGSSDGLWSCNFGSNEAWFAPRFKEMLGYADEELANNFALWEEHLHGDDRAATLTALRRHAHEEVACDLECRLRTREGDYRWFRVRGRSAQTAASAREGIAGSIQDITDLKQAVAHLESTSRALQRSNKDLEDFAYAASHDLRAPIRAISKLVQWLDADLQQVLSEEHRKIMGLVLSRVTRLDRMVDDLLQYSRVTSSRAQVEVVDVNGLVEEIGELLDLQARFSLVRDGLPTFATARTPLQQVLQNLIGNAVKHHNRERGRIEVRARELGRFYEFKVSDDGPGIPPSFQERAFRLFETLKPRDEVEGSGIGLALVKRAVERFGGSIAIESDGQSGTSFRFTWPVAMEDGAHTSASQRSCGRTAADLPSTHSGVGARLPA